MFIRPFKNVQRPTGQFALLLDIRVSKQYAMEAPAIRTDVKLVTRRIHTKIFKNLITKDVDLKSIRHTFILISEKNSISFWS